MITGSLQDETTSQKDRLFERYPRLYSVGDNANTSSGVELNIAVDHTLATRDRVCNVLDCPQILMLTTAKMDKMDTVRESTNCQMQLSGTEEQICSYLRRSRMTSICKLLFQNITQD
ncbi:Hypothetical predicted protein [Octopus vulgaris]|uniref:Uncharacterized protein n=1 Tax=Octopus vulgaris TaxID=6645 RepID=A0AA36BSG2_OCTVU|nr:Hypothetical predicted protein [Octopus vulgaris]